MKKFISLFVSAIILFSVFVSSVNAAGNTIIHFSSNTITIGNNVNVTVTITAPQEMKGLDYILSYDSEKLTYVSSSHEQINPNLAGRISVIDEPNNTSKSYTFVFKSKAVGSANISIKDGECVASVIVDGKATDTPLTGAGANLTVKDVELSNNANLKSLSLSAGNISPKFNANRTNYTASVPYETDKITFYATASDANNAKVSGISPNMPLKVGANTFNITVTAQNGSQKIYTVIVTRREKGAEETPVDPIPENPYETVISGKNYEIVTTIPGNSYLQGFTLSSADWNGAQVPVLRDKDNVFTVYYLREVGTTEIAPYLYNDELASFEALKHQVFNGILYIFEDFPSDMAMPGDYYSSYSQIGNYSVKVYLETNSQMSDFAYVYCYTNGNFGLYRYDSKENTIQRFPDIHLVDAPKADAPSKDNFSTRFASLSTNGKILLIAMLVASICVVALIVFLIITAFKKLFNKDLGYIEDDFEFDDVTIVNEEESSKNTK